ncbi:MAG: transporter substrate-binding domain-containing protein [Cyanobacteriota bacterium]|nr:transporter substrate-binding domain-containing protein [Cyanobacteriota bacterium]
MDRAATPPGIPWARWRSLALGLPLLAAVATPAWADPPLRVGVLDGSPPCSDQTSPGHWQGRAVDLWQLVASRERIPDLLEPYPNARALLEASRRGQVDVGVGCLTVSPERVGVYRFSLPFQEAGLALLMPVDRLALGRSLARALVSPSLLRVLVGYLLAIALLSWLVWRDEHRGEPGVGRSEQLRRYMLVFQVLATGPGTNVIVSSTHGHGLVLLSWLLRIVGASLIVSTVTLDVLQQPPATGDLPGSLADLAGRRVAARPGSVSETTLEQPPLAGRVTVVPLPTVADAVPLLLSQRADAVLADEHQLRHVRDTAPAWQRQRLQLVLEGTHPESQAFALSPRLDPVLEQRINRAISQAKRDGALPDP